MIQHEIKIIYILLVTAIVFSKCELFDTVKHICIFYLVSSFLSILRISRIWDRKPSKCCDLETKECQSNEPDEISSFRRYLPQVLTIDSNNDRCFDLLTFWFWIIRKDYSLFSEEPHCSGLRFCIVILNHINTSAHGDEFRT